MAPTGQYLYQLKQSSGWAPWTVPGNHADPDPAQERVPAGAAPALSRAGLGPRRDGSDAARSLPPYRDERDAQPAAQQAIAGGEGAPAHRTAAALCQRGQEHLVPEADYGLLGVAAPRAPEACGETESE